MLDVCQIDILIGFPVLLKGDVKIVQNVYKLNVNFCRECDIRYML